MLRQLCLVCLFISFSVQAQYQYAWQMGSDALGLAQFRHPAGIALDEQGNMYVADRENDRIQKFSPAGQLLLRFGYYGPTDETVRGPADVALDKQGNIYVADTGNGCVKKFSPGGKFLFKFGTPGTTDGLIYLPQKIALDAQENIYVLEYATHRVQKFTASGQFLFRFGSFGQADGQFWNPTDLVVDAAGNVYVADQANERIQKFNANGQFLSKIVGTGDRRFRETNSITLDAQGNIYLTEVGTNHRIQKFNANGQFLELFGSIGSGDGQLFIPTGIAVDGQGNMYVAENGNQRIQKLSPSGQFLFKFGTDGSGDGQFVYPRDVTLDGQGNVYVADRYNHRIQKLSPGGQFLAAFGSSGSADGQFRYPGDVALDGQGNLFVSDNTNHRIQKLSPGGQFIFKFGSFGSGNGQLSYPAGITLDGQGNIYVADNGNHRIQKFNANGQFLFGFGSFGSGDGQFNGPAGIALDGQGNMYVADANNHRIQKFTPNGQFLAAFGSQGPADEQLLYPTDVTLDGQGNIYVANYFKSCVHKYGPGGQFLLKFGAPGYGNGALLNPTGVALDKQNNVYVVDQHSHRVQKFVPDNCPYFVLAPATLPGGTVGTAYSQRFTGAPSGYAYSAAGLPTGLSISSSGIISGTPAAAGASPFAVVVTATNGSCSVSGSYSLAIAKGTANILIAHTDRIYDGTGQAASVTTTPAGLPCNITYDGSATLPVHPGTYSVAATVNASSYSGTATGTLTISKAPLLIRANDADKVYGFANPALSMHFEGFVNGEKQDVLDELPIIGTMATQNSAAGSYPITLSGGSDNNYRFILQPGALTVTKAAQTITFGPIADQTFGNGDVTLSASATSGLPVTYEVASGPAILSRGNTLSLTGTGRVTVRASQPGNANYQPAALPAEQSFCVLPAKPIITRSGNTLSSNATGSNQWNRDNAPISGATAATYLATVGGSYTVTVVGPCGPAVTSDAFPVTVSVTATAADQIVLYPNPARDNLFLRLPAGVSYQSVEVIDVLGRRLIRQPNGPANPVKLPVQTLAKGCYLLEVQTNAGLIYKKFVVQ